MPATSGNPVFEGISRRWHELAARRLGFYAALYQSGRWTLYFSSRQKFAAYLTMVMDTERTWARLAGRQPVDVGNLPLV
jgi:hypothetical protein